MKPRTIKSRTNKNRYLPAKNVLLILWKHRSQKRRFRAAGWRSRYPSHLFQWVMPMKSLPFLWYENSRQRSEHKNHRPSSYKKRWSNSHHKNRVAEQHRVKFWKCLLIQPCLLPKAQLFKRKHQLARSNNRLVILHWGWLVSTRVRFLSRC